MSRLGPLRVVGLALLVCLAALPAAARQSVTDMSGRVVALPDRVEAVACLEVLCYQKMLMLGAARKVRLMVDTAAPWMAAVDPEVAAVPRITGDANPEDLLVRHVDVAFYAYNPEATLAKLTSLGIPGLVSQPQGRKVDTAEAFVAETKRSLRLVAAVLGGEAVARAEDWCAYLDDRLRFVASRLAGLNEAQRLRLYYLRGPRAIDTQGIGSNTYWYGTLAGARMVVGDRVLGKGVVGMEDILRWNPQAVLVGRQYSPDLVLRDDRWADIEAVRSGRVFASPEGVFYWDGGIEGPLLLQFLAKRLYPERFADLDLNAELRAFYARFYRHPLTPAEADLLLQGRSPDGRRLNPMNN